MFYIYLQSFEDSSSNSAIHNSAFKNAGHSLLYHWVYLHNTRCGQCSSRCRVESSPLFVTSQSCPKESTRNTFTQIDRGHLRGPMGCFCPRMGCLQRHSRTCGTRCACIPACLLQSRSQIQCREGRPKYNK